MTEDSGGQFGSGTPEEGAPCRYTAPELQVRLASQDLLLLDIREPWEVETAPMAAARHLPIGQLPARIHELPTDREIVVICHHGVRSLAAAQWLLANGFERVADLEGGTEAWAALVDPGMTRY